MSLENKVTDILRIVDKIEKAGEQAVKEMLFEIEINDETAQKIIEFITRKENIISYLEGLNIENEKYLNSDFLLNT